MASKLPVWGIDVGQCSLKAMKLQQLGEDQVEMLAFEVIEYEKPLSQAGADATELVKKAIAAFLSNHALRDSQIVISVPGQQTLTRFTKMPPVERKKIPDMVQYEASQQIPFDMDEVVWDYQVFTEAESPDVEVGIFAIRKELIRNYLMQFTEAGIEPIIVQSSPMASYNAARFEQPSEEGKAHILLDMGAIATDLIVMEGNRIWSRPVPIGGNRFTESLVSAFKISFAKAERLKRNAAASKHARQIFQAMRPVLADLVSEIQRSIGFYTSTHREAHIAKVIGMGNAFKQPGLQKFLTQNLQIGAEKLSSFKKMVFSGELSSEFTENTMSFSVSYGLALQGLGMAAVASNLLPQEVRRTLLWRKKQPWFGASAAALALAAGSLWVGNVMGGGQVDSGMGDLTNLNPPTIPNIERAEQIIASGGNGTSLEKALQVIAAADRLKKEYALEAGKSAGDVASLEAMAKLPENNVFVPRILDAIHRAFEEASSPDVKGVRDSSSYLQLAKRIKRQERRELWIQRLEMVYDSKQPEATISKDQKKIGEGGAGWLVRIIGETTATSDEAPTWLADTLIASLTRLGRRPDRGVFFDVVELRNVTPRPKEGESTVGDLAESRGGGGGRGTGRSQAGGRGGGRGRVRQSGGDRRGIGGRGGQFDPRGPGGSRPGDAGEEGGSIADQIMRKQKHFEEHDPLTDEKVTEDRQFEIYIVVRKKDTPEKMIPPEYQEKREKKEKEEAGEADTADRDGR
ncbi:MAG: type IV pilus assembly protein PilM [Planctomycetota bacterium]